MFIAPSASFNRPANTTQYAQNELVANSASAGSVEPMRFGCEQAGGKGKIVAVRVFSDNQAVTAAVFDLFIFRQIPTVSVGDNAAFAVASVQQLLGVVACDMSSGATASATDKVKRFALTVPIVFELPSTSRALYALLATGTGGTYTPASGEQFEVTLEIEG